MISTRHLHISHNAPNLPPSPPPRHPQILRKHCFQFLLGRAVMPRKNEKFGALWEMCKWRIDFRYGFLSIDSAWFTKSPSLFMGQ